MRQLRRSFGVAFFSRGYQESGTEITRPSLSTTLTAPAVTFTAATRSSAASAEEPMPCLQQQLLILFHERFYLIQFAGTKAIIFRQRYSNEPILRRQIVTINVHVWWFIRLVAVKIEPIRT